MYKMHQKLFGDHAPLIPAGRAYNAPPDIPGGFMGWIKPTGPGTGDERRRKKGKAGKGERRCLVVKV